MNKNILIVACFGLAISVFYAWVLVACFNSTPPKDNKINKKDTLCLEEFNEDNFNKLMDILEIECPNIVIAQSKLETGNYTSSAFRNHNNLFGFMKGNSIRHYANWRESLIHYAHFQNINYKGGDYYKFLVDVKYASDTNYIYKLKQFK